MKQRYIWAVLCLIAGLLIYYVFQPVERHMLTTADIDNHAHNSHYFFADPKRLQLMFPDIIPEMRLKDAWVQGAGDMAMEVYDMPANTTIKMMGLQNITVMVTADVKRRQSMHTVSLIKDLIWARVFWKVDETGPTRMRSLIKQDVNICLPKILWTFVTNEQQESINTIFKEGLEKAKNQIEARNL